MMAQASFDDLLQCSICLERFTQPKMLPCQHTFCLNCLRGITKDAKTVDCPQCRKRHVVPEKGMSAFNDDRVINNLLAIVGDSVECHDCEKNHLTLTKCEHCDQQVCADCRAAHNRLQTEITILLQSIKEGVLHQVSDDEVDRRQVLQTSLDQLEKEETRLHEAFEEALSVLNERRDQLLRQLQITARFHKALIEKNENRIMEQFQQELRECQNVESLRLLKGSLVDADKVLSSVQTLGTGVEFSCDMSNVTEFGRFICGDQTCFKHDPRQKRGTTPVDGKEREARSRDEQVGQAVAAGTRPVRRPGASVSGASGEAASNRRYPANVDYQIRNDSSWELVIKQHPEAGKYIKPTYAEYSVFHDSIYCISEYAILVYNMCGGEGKSFTNIMRAEHLAISDSGKMLIIDDQNVVRVNLNQNDVDPNLLQVKLTSYFSRAVQLCCHGNEFAVLDVGKKCLMTFSEDGKFIREFGADKLLEITEKSRMCVDREGRIYVTSVRVVDRKESKDVYCPTCHKPRSVTVTTKSVVVVLSWEGEFVEEIEMDGWSKKYDYTFDGPDCDHSRQVTYRQRNEDSVPSNEHIMRENMIGGICVDADGYISITLTGKNTINVYNPKRELHCTIGDPVKRPGEFKEPSGVNLMPDGRLIVCDTGNKRIQII